MGTLRLVSLEETPLDAYSRVVTEVDRKSTRLNSSHLVISYAVFCLKKKTFKPRSLAISVLTHGKPSKEARLAYGRPCTRDRKPPHPATLKQPSDWQGSVLTYPHEDR